MDYNVIKNMICEILIKIKEARLEYLMEVNDHHDGLIKRFGLMREIEALKKILKDGL